VLDFELRARGMPAQYVVFHSGLSLSAFDIGTRKYVELEPTGFRVLRAYPSLDEWYVATLRAEYGERHGLAKCGDGPHGR